MSVHEAVRSQTIATGIAAGLTVTIFRSALMSQLIDVRMLLGATRCKQWPQM